MKTRRSLKPDDVLLVGRLYSHGVARRPYLGIEVWCPRCKRLHTHGWPDVMPRSDAVSHRVAHCDVPVTDPGYYIGLDPSHEAHNKRVASEHRTAIAKLPATALAM